MRKAQWPAGIWVAAGFFDAGAASILSGRGPDHRGFGPSMVQDLLGPEWDLTTFREARDLVGSIDNWLRTFKVR